ncbi:FUSC family protein [Thalassospira sp. MCCC 1A01428]|uniref:FUSC family protein n=1 Tax=Thalassospira sp. MCCC 1A01428 TaxID=1470575 RepID=UPI001AEFC2E1|nr:FUSC family protein [Thalassospira sp. MCCC 1A01428]
MSFPTWRDWIFSSKAFVASMLALYIALFFDLPRPYWAMAAVYVVSNPLAGATGSKAMYRALGTVIGACAAVFFVPIFVNSPELLSLVVALWTGVLLYISMLDRTPRSYVFMLAGYTLPLIALPDVGTPELIFDTALARSEEIILGILCASIVNAVVFPVSVNSLLDGNISKWLNDAASWADEILRGEGAIPETPVKRQKLAADITGLNMLLSQLRYDVKTREVVRPTRELRGRLLMLLPLFSSLADRLHALKQNNHGLPADISPVLCAVADWFDTPQNINDETTHALIARIDAADISDPTKTHVWDNMVRASVMARLREIVYLWRDCNSLRDIIADGKHKRHWRALFRHRKVIGQTRYYDYGMMLFSCGSTVLATLIASLAWIQSGWQYGAGAVLMTAVSGSFFAAMDRPAPFIMILLKWFSASLALSFVYLFLILPRIDGFPLLVLVFAPPFLILGTLMPRPQYAIIAMLLTVSTASFIALQNRFSVNFDSFLNGGIASLIGIAFSLVWTLLVRPFGSELAARRLMRAGWADLANTAAGQHGGDHAALSGRMLDRLGQLVPRLASLEDRELAKVDGFAEVRLGFNILVLQRERRRVGPASRDAIDTVLSAIAGFFTQRLKQGKALEPDDALLFDIEHCLKQVANEPAGKRAEALDALVGVKRVLFPNATSASGILTHINANDRADFKAAQ